MNRVTLDGYKCCKDNKTVCCAMTVREGTKGGDRAPLHLYQEGNAEWDRTLKLSNGRGSAMRKWESEHLGIQNGALQRPYGKKEPHVLKGQSEGQEPGTSK